MKEEESKEEKRVSQAQLKDLEKNNPPLNEDEELELRDLQREISKANVKFAKVEGNLNKQLRSIDLQSLSGFMTEQQI
jgi:uncharacterized protein YpuA (DUF1002 family)